MITPKYLKKFKELYFQKFNIELDDEETTKLSSLMSVLSLYII